MFTPSATRVVPSAARDWSYVDTWLSTHFGRQIPPFERNPDTLKALLALAAFNESAQEERQLLHRANFQALDDLSTYEASDPTSHNSNFRTTLLDIVEHDLSKEGKTALDALANMALRSDNVLADPEELGRAAIETQASLYEAEQMAARVEALEAQIQRESTRIKSMIELLGQDNYKPPSDISKRNTELERSVKSMTSQLAELNAHGSPDTGSFNDSGITIDDIVREEQDYLALLEQKTELDHQIAAFHGLPSDPERARTELDTLRNRLLGITSRRDAAFEGLVERESPAKRR